MTSGRVHTDPRIVRRRKAIARSKRKRFFIGSIALALIGAGVWLMFWSPLFVVSEVKVVGAERTDFEDVQAAAAVVGTDQNLLLLGTDQVRARVLKLPWIAAATVERMLPGTVRIRVREREPALILSIGSDRWTIDADGHVLAVGEAEPGLPVLAGVEVGSVEPGVRLLTQEARDALSAYEALPPGVRARVAGIFAPTPERLSFTLADGLDIRIGSARQMRAKTEVLRRLLARIQAEGRSVGYIDVSVPTSPAIGGSAEAPEDESLQTTP
jgi:cell division protein FtsQ